MMQAIPEMIPHNMNVLQERRQEPGVARVIVTAGVAVVTGVTQSLQNHWHETHHQVIVGILLKERGAHADYVGPV